MKACYVNEKHNSMNRTAQGTARIQTKQHNYS